MPSCRRLKRVNSLAGAGGRRLGALGALGALSQGGAWTGFLACPNRAGCFRAFGEGEGKEADKVPSFKVPSSKVPSFLAKQSKASMRKARHAQSPCPLIEHDMDGPTQHAPPPCPLLLVPLPRPHYYISRHRPNHFSFRPPVISCPHACACTHHTSQSPTQTTYIRRTRIAPRSSSQPFLADAPRPLPLPSLTRLPPPCSLSSTIIGPSTRPAPTKPIGTATSTTT